MERTAMSPLKHHGLFQTVFFEVTQHTAVGVTLRVGSLAADGTVKLTLTETEGTPVVHQLKPDGQDASKIKS
jgi:hypothetical protein